jgi:hypothetical protein
MLTNRNFLIGVAVGIAALYLWGFIGARMVAGKSAKSAGS